MPCRAPQGMKASHAAVRCHDGAFGDNHRGTMNAPGRPLIQPNWHVFAPHMKQGRAVPVDPRAVAQGELHLPIGQASLLLTLRRVLRNRERIGNQTRGLLAETGFGYDLSSPFGL